MVTRYFVNGGVDTNWETSGNWSATDGGAGGASVPGVGDTAIINENSSINCQTNGAITVATLRIGHNTFGKGRLTLGGNLTVTSLSIGVTVVGGNDVHNQGQLIAGSYTITVSTTFNNNNSGFIRGTSTVITNGDVTFGGLATNSNLSLYNLQINSGTITFQLSFSAIPKIDIWGLFTAKNCTLQWNGAGPSVKLRIHGTQDVSNVVANHISSEGGKRIYNSGGTLTNSPFWRTSARTTVHVTTVAGLQAINNDTNNNYILDNNIDLTGVNWTPLGTLEDPFTGEFNGNGKTISNLSNNAGNTNFIGFFGYLGSAAFYRTLTTGSPSFSSQQVIPAGGYEQAIVHDFIISGINLNGSGRSLVYGIGSFCAWLECGNIYNVNIVTSSLKDNGNEDGSSIGGFIGQCFGQHRQSTIITNCSINGLSVTGANQTMGGFIGYMSSLEADPVIGDILITDSNIVNFNIPCINTQFGGFIGEGAGFTCNNCYANGSFVLSQGGCGGVGGFMGYSALSSVMSFINCHAIIQITTAQGIEDFSAIGGFIGSASSGMIFYKCYSEGNIKLDGISSGFAGIGGFAGVMSVDCKDCYSHVTINAIHYQEVGGFVGSSNSGQIKNCYAYGNVTADDSVGGFIGGEYGSLKQNVFSVGIITANTNFGGFIGKGNAVLNLDNCSWWSGSSSHAIGNNNGAGAVNLLSSGGYGTDEPDKTKFQNNVSHAVFAQGTGTEWKFDRTQS